MLVGLQPVLGLLLQGCNISRGSYPHPDDGMVEQYVEISSHLYELSKYSYNPLWTLSLRMVSNRLLYPLASEVKNIPFWYRLFDICLE